MARNKVRAPARRPEEEDAEPAESGLPEAPEPAGRTVRVQPLVAEDGRTRFEAAPDEDVYAISQRDYRQLAEFLDGLSDKDRYHLALWRCDPRMPAARKRQNYLPGGMEIPDGMLEDSLSELHGPGVYRWQLLRDGRYASPDKLPPSLKGVGLAGYIQIAGKPLIEGDGAGGLPMMPPPPADTGTELLRDLLQQQREDARNNRSEMADILRANTDGFKVQMSGMVETMKAQTMFLQHQLEQTRLETKERTAEKDGMWKEIVGLVKDLRGEGDTRSTADRLLENAPLLIDKLQTAGLFAAKPGAPPAAPAPAQSGPPATPPPDRPMEGLKPEERNNTLFMYITGLVNKLHSCYQSKVEPDLAAESISRIGTDAEFDWLMEQGEETVVSTVDSLHKRFKGAPAGEELLAYVRAVWAELLKETEPAAGPDAPAAPAAGPAATGQVIPAAVETPPAAPGADSGANGPGVQP